MDIPEHVIQAFKPLTKTSVRGIRSIDTLFTQNEIPFDPSTISQEEIKPLCPIGCDPHRKEFRISKPGKRNKGNFVVVNYRKTSKAFAEKVRRSKFEIFNNADWSN